MNVRYRAVQPIMFDGVLAHAPGDEVPAVNVERNGWSDLVEKITEPKPEGSDLVEKITEPKPESKPAAKD